VADVVRVRVHHPAHDFFIGADVGCGHVGVRPEKVHHLLHVAPREPLDFVLGKLIRVDHHAAFRAAVREAG